MPVPLAIKYAGRHALKRNPWVLQRFRAMMTREFAAPAFHDARQEQWLERLFRAARHIPAYSRIARGAPPRQQLAYLRDAFPIIDKATLLASQDEFFTKGRPPRHNFNVATTSGTTGTPLDVYRSFGSMLEEEAFHLQHWHWAGWRRGQRQAVLRGDLVVPIERRHEPFWFRDPVGGQLILSTRHLDKKTAVAFANELRAYGATQLRAYPSAAYDLALLVEESGIPVHFTSVITGSEMLYDFQRRRIEAAFHTRVYDFYSMAERVAWAAECEHGRMHVNPEYGVVEIVDEHGRPTAEEGMVVGTSLSGGVMPLIRYRMNDTGRWGREPCPCGRSYPVIDRIGGRLADQLYDLDGRAVNCTVIGFAFDGLHNIRRAQVAQTAADRWVIRIVPGEHYTAVDGQRVLAKLASHVSARVVARIEIVKDIAALSTGKYKWVVQEFRPALLPADSRARAPAGSIAKSAC